MEQTLGKRISQSRRKNKLTQEQLAEKLGVTAQAISKWENDQSCPDITMLPRLAEIFATTTDALLGIEDTQTIHEAEIVFDQPAEAEPDGLHISKDGFEFKLDNNTRSGSIGIAVLVLAVGGLTLLSELLKWDVSFWSILWPTALLVFGIFGIMPKFSFFRLGCLIFGGYFLLENLNLLPFDLGWGLVLPICLLLFGISLLVDALKKPKKSTPAFSVSNTMPQQKSRIDNGILTYNADFGSDIYCISTDRLCGGSISTSFGDYTIDLTEVEEISQPCRLDIECSFGNLALLVPSRYQVNCDKSTSFAHIEICGEANPRPDGYLSIGTDVNFAKLTIKYI